jgi:hypothetical protein
MANVKLNLSQVIGDEEIFRIPRVVTYNRLEARPRTLDFTGSLSAEVRDPLWMLTRQWQFGEFEGEDASSPVTARISYRHESMNRVALPKGQVLQFDFERIPLETQVERERIPLTVRKLAGAKLFSDVLLSVQWGKQLLRMLRDALIETHYDLYLKDFPIRVLPDAPPPKDPVRVVLDAEAEQVMTSVAGRIADGVAIWLTIQSGDHDSWLATKVVGDKATIKGVADSFGEYCSAKFNRLFTQPDTPTDSAWLPNHLEYEFSVGGQPAADGSQTILAATQYPGGHLDWFSFDSVTNEKIALEEEGDPLDEGEQIESFLPGPVRFKGQPQPRFWEMEETETDFGKIETSATGLLHLMLAEFGLIYSNDWFMLPHPMPVNTVCEIRGLLVDDTFGRHTFIRPAGREQKTGWQRWAVFHLTEQGQQWPSTNRFYLVPAVGKVLESEPLERVNFLRDEMANMVWGVESIIPSQAGVGMSGYETTPPNPRITPRNAPADDVKIAYVLGTTVPKNWIPFIPVHAKDSVSEIRLQRARMVGSDPPRGWLLREQPSPYFVEEEEIPRAGIYVDRSWQRARWIHGKTFVWVGRRKTAGKGEGWSQLVFDQIVDLPPTKP